ncbi:ATPase [Deltaproteobacteria bacterium Smac51]|nr:ATPase [Deltaproteobacteria bacterium Smac51]
MSIKDSDRFFVITGPEGAGKTTLTQALERAGFDTVIESTREVWRYQERIGGRYIAFSGGSQLDEMIYFELSLAFDIRSYDQAAAKTGGPVIFDRGMLDIIIFMRHLNLPVPDHIIKAVRLHPYNRTVFMAPFRADIYTQDPERVSTAEEAAAQEPLFKEIYAEFGYELLYLPTATVEERVRFVAEHVRLDQRVRSAVRQALLDCS